MPLRARGVRNPRAHGRARHTGGSRLACGRGATREAHCTRTCGGLAGHESRFPARTSYSSRKVRNGECVRVPARTGGRTMRARVPGWLAYKGGGRTPRQEVHEREVDIETADRVQLLQLRGGNCQNFSARPCPRHRYRVYRYWLLTAPHDTGSAGTVESHRIVPTQVAIRALSSSKNCTSTLPTRLANSIRITGLE